MKLKMQTFTAYTFLISFLLICSSCATIVSKSKYPISINSKPSGADIVIKDVHGIAVYSGITPASVILDAGAGFFTKNHYTVEFSMDGRQIKTVPIFCSLDGWYIGNLVFGGLIGWLIVDPATGAMWKIDTRVIDETLQKNAMSQLEPSLKIYNYRDIPESWKDNLVRLK